jgi:hypothetical protein
MKTIILAAMALAAVATTGCTDDKALGEERMKDSAHLAPAQHDDVLHQPSVPQGEPAPSAKIPSEAPDPQARRNWVNDPTGERAANEPQVINGEDLDAIPDQVGPLWSSDTDAAQTPMDEKGKTQIVGKPGEPLPAKER